MRGSRRQQMWHICPALAIECYEEERQAARTAPLRPSFRRDNRARNPSQPFCPRVLGWYHDFNCNDYPIAAARFGGRAGECDPMELPQTGGCQCGAVRYEITQAPIIVYTCHCTDCQRTTGSGRVSTRWVCPECGVWVCTAPRPGSTVRNVRGGTLDDTSWLRPTAHIWTRSRQPWVPIPEGGRNFETQPPGDPWWASVTPTG